MDTCYQRFMEWLAAWAANPEAVREFLAEENMRIDPDMTDMIRRLYGDGL